MHKWQECKSKLDTCCLSGSSVKSRLHHEQIPGCGNGFENLFKHDSVELHSQMDCTNTMYYVIHLWACRHLGLTLETCNVIR